ncbi:Pol polyprotein [Elysia marginata]|uniref:Pol polyprotein n=1 Tax=Elysia marginata TaxID=1093978 RepID=A0AAV4H5F2_9GAST|nr:Pol polyprotein [Elysia marginata]
MCAEAGNVKLPTIDTAKLSEEQQQDVQSLLEEYKDIFSQSDTDIGHYTGVKHAIHLEDKTPFKQRFRRIPPHMIDEVRDHILQLQASGVIRPSQSPYSSPVVCCRKKDGSLRLCVDYRLLNSKTKKDNYCLPRIEELLDCMKGAQYFTKLDLKSGYHHIDIREDHKERTAFTVGPL